MRDLFLALPRLDATDRRTARHLLARPTDGASDPLGDGYTQSGGRAGCLRPLGRQHRRRPPSRAWVRTTLRTLNSRVGRGVGDLGYREPRGDGRTAVATPGSTSASKLGSRPGSTATAP